MFKPQFPTLTPRIIDPLWFNVDQPCDEEAEVSNLEQDHQAWMNSIWQKFNNIIPIGKAASENIEEDDDEDDEDDNDDDTSESHDEDDEDEMEMDISQERNSPEI